MNAKFKEVLKLTGGGLINLIRVILFFILYWLRAPVILVCELVSAPMLFAFLFSWWAFPDKPHLIWGFAILGVGALVVRMIYDYILMFLSPTELFLEL